jgi:hypothetical protein
MSESALLLLVFRLYFNSKADRYGYRRLCECDLPGLQLNSTLLVLLARLRPSRCDRKKRLGLRSSIDTLTRTASA